MFCLDWKVAVTSRPGTAETLRFVLPPSNCSVLGGLGGIDLARDDFFEDVDEAVGKNEFFDADVVISLLADKPRPKYNESARNCSILDPCPSLRRNPPDP